MSEPILDALMQLFALIIDIDEDNKISEKEKEVIRSFLTQQLNRSLAEKYMLVFEQYLLLFHKDDYYQDSSRKEKRKSLAEKKILSICERINEELQQSQKVYVLIQLIEFISLGDLVSEKEKDFLSMVAKSLKIPDGDYHNIFMFIAGTVRDVEEREKLLVINSSEKCTYKEIKHIYDPHLSGEVFFLRIESTNSYILRYYGYTDVYLNSQNIISGRTYVFEHGSSVRSHNIKTIFYTDVVRMFSSISSDSNISVNARDVEFRFKNTRNGIQKFNMSARSGTLVAIMGGSGVGKSTLINVLNGNIRPDKGEVFFNNYNLNDPEERNKLKGIIGLVPQDDLLIEDLSVYQNLYYSAKLCLGNLNESEIESAVERTLQELELTEAKDLKVGSPLKKVISGGQRKRLNIALELIREPSVLFIDEPTSGLSSIEAENVMNLLKEQSDSGKMVIVNIHQPSSYLYKMFDKILILDKGGYQIYYGNPMEAIVYFKRMSNHANPGEDQCSECGTVNTDQLLQIIDAKVVNEHGKLTGTRKMSPEEWSLLFDENIDINHDIDVPDEKIPESDFRIPGKLKQLLIFFKRDIVSKLANRQYILITLTEAPLLAFILGYFTKYVSGTEDNPLQYVFYKNENLTAYLFMCVVVSLFLGLIISSEEIIKDRKILKRESFLNLSRGSYLNSKIILLFILSAIQTLSFVLIGNLILEIKDMTLSYWAVLFSTSCFANMMGLNISSAFDKVITVYVLIPFLLIPQLLLSGVIVKFDKLHYSITKFESVPLVGDVMASRWAYEALAVHQFKENRFESPQFKYKLAKSHSRFVTDDLIRKLRMKVEICNKTYGRNEYMEQFEEEIYKLSKYLGRLSDEAGFDNSELVSKLNTTDYDSITGIQALSRLSELNDYYLKEYNTAKELHDKELLGFEERYGIGSLDSTKMMYHNERLEFSMRNSHNRIFETRTSLIQKFDPIYRMPQKKNGRAHFYAPYKKIGNRTFETHTFNIVAIWILSLLLYLTLYWNILRKTLKIFSRK